MSVVVRNALPTHLDIPGAGLVFGVGEEKTVSRITVPLAEALQAGHVVLVSQDSTVTVTVEETGQTVFDLPFPWSGPDEVQLVVGGLVQVFGEDWTVDAATNRFEWLDEDVELEAGDTLILLSRRTP